MKKKKLSVAWKGAGIGLAVAGLTAGGLAAVSSPSATAAGTSSADSATTTTPIKHLVVIFDENITYDHYFGTYPKAANTDGTKFNAVPGTPTSANYLSNPSAVTSNPNLYAPFRLTPSQAVTCDQGHSYTPEEKAMDGGKGDKFVESVSTDSCTGGPYQRAGLTMGYYDGNTVTGLWNYAQNYAMSDNAWTDTFGPSTPGALELASGETHGATSYYSSSKEADDGNADGSLSATINNDDEPAGTNADGSKHAGPTQTKTPDSYDITYPDATGVGTVTNDPDPVYDDCADTDHTGTSALAGLSGKNIGDQLNAKNLTWGWFEGGFNPSTAWKGTGTYAKCDTTTSHMQAGATASYDYIPHHDPFQYYASTSNPHHLPGTSGVAVGAADPSNDTTKTGANHQYDTSVFDSIFDKKSANYGELPAVSFIKAPGHQDGHPAYSDPLDEQYFLANTINEIEKSPEWASTAIVITYDDSDGWYDHVIPTITNGSKGSADDTICTNSTAPAVGGEEGRCGPGQRIPFLLISPYAKQNYISHDEVTQSSVDNFIEYNWGVDKIGGASFADADPTKAGQGSAAGILDMMTSTPSNATPVLLNENTGAVMSGGILAKSQAAAKSRLANAERSLKAAKSKLARDTKAAKRAHGGKKKGANKKVAADKRKVARLTKTVANDKKQVSSLS